MNRVLVFSPDAQRLAALQRVLMHCGLAVHGGTQLQTVLQLSAKGGVSMVVGDLPTPEAALALQAALTAQPSAVPVLMLLQRADDASLGMLFQCGVADVQEQPMSQEMLRERVMHLLGTLSAPPPTTPGAYNALGLKRLTDFLVRAQKSGLVTVDTVHGRAHIMLKQGTLASGQFGDLAHEAAVSRVLSMVETHGFFFQPVANDASIPTPAVANPGGSTGEAGAPAAGQAQPPPTNLDWCVTEVVPGSPRTAGTPPPQKVLVVDDDEALLEIACRFMARGGFEVDRAMNGAQAMQVALRFAPQVVVSDIMMPDVDGWALLRQVRTDHRLKELPFVLLSCHDEYRDRLRQVGSGADAYLAKGIKGDQLMKTVQEVGSRFRRPWTESGPGRRLEGRLEVVGALNLIRALVWHKLTGTLHAQDDWGQAVLGIQDGQLVGAGATADLMTMTGMDAVIAYVKMRKARFVFDPMQLPPQGEGADVEAALEEACIRANKADEEVQEKLLVEGGALNIQPELMALYESVTSGVPAPVLAALARGLSPGAVMAETGESPLLVEWVVKDLVRKGVAVFGDPPKAEA